MKILILANSDVGLYQFRGELMKELLKKNTVLFSVPNGEMIDDITKLGATYIETAVDRRGINPLKDMKLLFNYRRILRLEKPDMVITYTIKPNVYGGLVCRLYRIPYAVNITGLGTTFQKDGMLKKFVTILYKVGLKKTKIVFFENCENQQIFIDLGIVKQEKTCLLSGAGVDLNKFQVMEYPAGGVTKFLFIGRVMKEKGINELFDAMKKLIASGIDCRLDVVGEYEEDYTAIIEQYEAEGWLYYHGYQKDVHPFIAKCHCFVLPSWHEGMANTSLESAASGRPVITSNIHGCLEAVIDGKTGYLAERKNAEELYKKMKKFTELSYEERMIMGLAGRKHMEDVFDKRKVVEETIRCLFS